MSAWTAKWIGPSPDPRDDLGVFAFRTTVTFEKLPAIVPVRISADNRYKLLVNGEFVSFGPQRGDLQHWFYDHFDLAPFLRLGRNEIVALVWNFGRWAPMAQISARTSFLFDLGPTPEALGELITPGEWQVARIPDWGFAMMHSNLGEFYIDVGPGEIIPPVAGTFLSPVSALEWGTPHLICAAEERNEDQGGTPWMLIPRTIPAMRFEVREARPVVRRDFQGSGRGELAFPFHLAPNERMLLDYGELLCAYPRIAASGGGPLTITYAEALWDGNEKGDRNEVAGKEMRGVQDKLTLAPDPATFEPLWWRTYRYLTIEATETATIQSIDAIETGYPIQVESRFEADDPAVKPIWDVAVRTVERCAGETYFDCPYYEQLQYAGDTRIQALIGYYLGRDRRLPRNAIETLGWSMMGDGLTQSRYPSRQAQIIPPFTAFWALMLYDQALYDTERTFDAEAITMMANVMEGYRRSLLEGTHWHFWDWTPEWRAGVPPGQNPTAGRLLAEMVRLAKMWKLTKAIFAVEDQFALEFDELDEGDAFEAFRSRPEYEREDGLVRDAFDDEWTPSEHTEAMFRLYQQMLGQEPDPWPYSALERADAAKCTFYFAYYKHLAMRPDDYMAQLGPWKQMIEDGLTTFAETPEPTRSDCHAWSAHPILGFFQIIAGVTSIAPSWRKARIEPRPGSLKRFDARIAHPSGELRIAYDGGRLAIDTPIPCDLVWQGKSALIRPGKHSI